MGTQDYQQPHFSNIKGIAGSQSSQSQQFQNIGMHNGANTADRSSTQGTDPRFLSQKHAQSNTENIMYMANKQVPPLGIVRQSLTQKPPTDTKQNLHLQQKNFKYLETNRVSQIVSSST